MFSILLTNFFYFVWLFFLVLLVPKTSLAFAQPQSTSRSTHSPLQLNIAPLDAPSSSRAVSSSGGERNTNNVKFRPVHFTQLQLTCIRFNRELTGRNAVLIDEGTTVAIISHYMAP